MANDTNHNTTNWPRWQTIVEDHKDDLLRAFNVSNGQIVIGRVEDWIDICAEGYGAAYSSPAAKKIVGDVPVYMCVPMPGSNTSNIEAALFNNMDGAEYVPLTSVQSMSSALPGAILPSQMGAWWWLPLMASMALAVVA